MANVTIEKASVHVIGSTTYIHANLEDQDFDTMIRIGKGVKAVYGSQYELSEDVMLFLRK